MNFIKKLFGRQPVNIQNASDFWKWFADHEKTFFKVVKNQDKVDEKFFDELLPRLHQLNNNFYCLTGMYDEQTAELVISAEGEIKTFVFAEDLVTAAPSLPGWKFTALKPAIGLDTAIEMDGVRFSAGNISFYTTTDEEFPDEIDLTFVHADYTEANNNSISSGIQIFLENALGELKASTQIDSMRFGAANGNTLIPVSKLSEYLTWREAEFVEKYKNTARTGEDSFSLFKAQDEFGKPVFATLNTSLLQWDAKPSHPWFLLVEVEYEYDEQGLPDKPTQDLLYNLEDELTPLMEEGGGCLYLGRKTNSGSRMIYFACREFREVSRKADAFIRNHPDCKIQYEIYKDKYWMTMNMFKTAP